MWVRLGRQQQPTGPRAALVRLCGDLIEGDSQLGREFVPAEHRHRLDKRARCLPDEL